MTLFSTDKLDRALGVYLALSAVVNAGYYSMVYGAGASDLLWFCNVAMILAAVGFFTKNSRLLSAVLAAAISAQFFWIFADLAYLAGKGPAGRLHWLGGRNSFFSFLFDLNYHFSVIPLAALGVWKRGYHRRAYVTVVSIFLPLLVVTWYITQAKDNINCVFYPCDVGFTDDHAEIYGLKYFIVRCVSFAVCIGVIDLALRKIFPRASS